MQVNTRQIKWIGLVTTVFLVMVTYALLQVVERFIVQDEKFLLGVETGLSDWGERGQGETVFSANELVISNHENGNLEVTQPIPVEAPTYLKLSFDASSLAIATSGEEYWHGATASLKLRNHEEVVTKVSYVTLLDQASPMTSYSHVEFVGEEIKSVIISFRLTNSVGSLRVIDPVLSVLSESRYYRSMANIISVVWMFVGLTTLIFAVRVLPRYQTAIALLLLALLFVGTLMPQSLMVVINKSLVVGVPKSLLSNLPVAVSDFFGFNRLTTEASSVSKLGHVAVFFVVGVFAGLNQKKMGFVFAALLIVVFALLTEVLQLLIDGRTARIHDVFLDLFGGFSGLVLGSLLSVCLAGLLYVFRGKYKS